LLVHGEQSDILLPPVAQAMCEANPRIQRVDIPRAGHFVHDDNFPAFNQAVTSFLESLPG
jgi:pimeloyl-ACP methyl ester carboxylesterase